VLLGIAALIAFSTSPVFGHHLAGRADAVLLGRDHLWSLCLVALHELLAPLHIAFHVLLVLGLAYAAWDRWRGWRQLRGSLAPLAARAPSAGDAWWCAARAAELDPRRVRVVDGLPNPAFTAGWLSPLVYVASHLPRALSPGQLTAVCAHEAAHVRRRDPLRLGMLRFMARALFWIPALRRLAEDVADEAEVEADDCAARRDPLALASAILAVAGGPLGLPFDLAVGFGKPDLVDRRVRRLVGEDTPVGTHLTRRSLAGAAFVLVAVWTSGLMMAHPMPTPTEGSMSSMGMGMHCEHHRALAIEHLFCRGLWYHASGPCPHASRTSIPAATRRSA
jgi:Zn-dependent protease with chaperone function